MLKVIEPARRRFTRARGRVSAVRRARRTSEPFAWLVLLPGVLLGIATIAAVAYYFTSFVAR